MTTTVVLTILTVATLALRYLTIAQPLYQFIPPKYRWIPSATLAGLTVLTTPGVDFGSQVVAAIVAFALAAQAGIHAPVKETAQ